MQKGRVDSGLAVPTAHLGRPDPRGASRRGSAAGFDHLDEQRAAAVEDYDVVFDGKDLTR